MANQISIAVSGHFLPSWAVGIHNKAFWFYENEFGVLWVAKQEQDKLLIAGAGLHWNEFALDLFHAMAEKQRLRHLLQMELLASLPGAIKAIEENYLLKVGGIQEPDDCPLRNVMLSTGEQFWLHSVLLSAIPMLEQGLEHEEHRAFSG